MTRRPRSSAAEPGAARRSAGGLEARHASLEARRHWDGPASERAGAAARTPLIERHLQTALDAVRVRPGEDVLLDYGCGSGTSLLYAARYPFQRVVGVEPAPALAREARRRAACARERLCCPDIVVERAEATAFDVPDDVSVVLLSSALEDRALDRVLARLEASFARAPRALRVACLCRPEQEQRFAAARWMRALGRLPSGLWTDLRFTLYAACGLA